MNWFRFIFEIILSTSIIVDLILYYTMFNQYSLVSLSIPQFFVFYLPFGAFTLFLYTDIPDERTGCLGLLKFLLLLFTLAFPLFYYV